MIMETDIKRINFFDGLFLKEGEFLAEQLYHVHMRRRINYLLFANSGVVPIDTGDLRVTPTTGKRFRVTPGMAVSVRDDLKEGREVILVSESVEIDLAALGFSGSDEAFVAVHYEDRLSEPQTGVDPATETRVNEQGIVTVHDAWPPAAPLPDGEQYIRLGSVRFSDMHVSDGSSYRDVAVARSALFGGGVSPTGPSIVSITPNSGAPGDSIAGAVIAGSDLAGGSVTAPPAEITNIVVHSATDSEIHLDFEVQPGATIGGTTITVTTAGGTATVAFTVVAAAPVVVGSFGPAFRTPGQPVTLAGTNIRNSADTVGTVVRLVDAVDTTQVRATISPVDFVADSGGGLQRIRFNAPAAGDVTPPPGIPSVQLFRIRVDFGGGQGLSPDIAGNLQVQYSA
jgi:hypothetical protein